VRPSAAEPVEPGPARVRPLQRVEVGRRRSCFVANPDYFECPSPVPRAHRLPHHPRGQATIFPRAEPRRPTRRAGGLTALQFTAPGDFPSRSAKAYNKFSSMPTTCNTYARFNLSDAALRRQGASATRSAHANQQGAS